MDKLQKRFISHYFIAVNGTLFFYVLSFYILELYNWVFLMSLALVIHIILMVAVYPFKFDEIKVYIPPYIILISGWLYIVETPVWQNLSIGLLWFFLIPLGLRNIYPNNRSPIIKASILSFFLAILSILTPDKFTISLLPENIGKRILFNVNLINIIPAIFFFFIIEFYHYKIIATIKDSKNRKDISINLTALHKTKKIYNSIKVYFEKEKSWKNPEFTLQDLADEIGYSSKDISNALKLQADMNFSLFLNKYRIRAIIEELQTSDEYSRYNMSYIYSKVGFKNQTTFNQTFKFFIKMTPTEYIKTIKNNKG